MPKASTRPTPAVLCNSADQNLKLYSTAAIAAGVSILALAPPAEGKLVITRKTIPIPLGQTLSIDLNHDGIADFDFNLRSSAPDCFRYGSLWVNALAGDAVVGGPYASALVRRANIGPSAPFIGTDGDRVTIESYLYDFCSGDDRRSFFGNWSGNPPNRYLGVKFLIHGAVHYGWIRLTVNFLDRGLRSATITAYAYETVANKTIVAGHVQSSASQSSAQQLPNRDELSLGMLALGADGLTLWRRDLIPKRR